jgi:hypothetical protein
MNRGGTSRKKIKGKITLTDRRRFLEQLKDGLIGFFSTNTYTSELGREHRVGRADDDNGKHARATRRAALINEGFAQTGANFKKEVNSQSAPLFQQKSPPHISITPCNMLTN